MSSELNSTAASLLGFLASGSMSGWELAEAVEATIGNFWNVTRSQIYRELAGLSERGLVQRGEAGPRNRRRYTITASGRDAFSEWIRREPGPELIRFPLLLTLFFGDHVSPEDLAGFVDTHRRRHEQRLASYRTMIKGTSEESPPIQTLRFGIAYEEAFLKWLDGLPFDSPQREPLATVPREPVRPGPRHRRTKAKA
ncbi:MAG TPA: helix-turn-helix transcriptional regulator [Actinomycetota bacterium]|jgi:DNA-binding PadR family transcriptional regulator|nr:helix-turn-helix transcriptional regulator [Actinomycetota bacterium]